MSRQMQMSTEVHKAHVWRLELPPDRVELLAKEAQIEVRVVRDESAASQRVFDVPGNLGERRRTHDVIRRDAMDVSRADGTQRIDQRIDHHPRLITRVQP